MGEDLLYNIVGKKPMPPTPWVFSGSRFMEGEFMAGIGRSYSTTFHDPFMINVYGTDYVDTDDGHRNWREEVYDISSQSGM